MATEVLHLDEEILNGAYQQLVKSKAGFDAAKNVAEDISGAIGKPAPVARKVTEFADSWSVNRDRLSQSIGKLSEKLKGIIDAFDDYHDKLATALQDATNQAGGTTSGGTTSGGSSTSGGSPHGSSYSGGGASGSWEGSSSGGSGGSGEGSSGMTSSAAIGSVSASADHASMPPGIVLPLPGEAPPGPSVEFLPDSPDVPQPTEPSPSDRGSAGLVGAGGLAIGAGSAAAAGTLFRAWSGRSTATAAPTAAGVESRAALGAELRGMRSAPSAGATAAGGSMNRSSVASLFRQGGSASPTGGPLGMGHSAFSREEREDKRRRRVAQAPHKADYPESQSTPTEPADATDAMPNRAPDTRARDDRQGDSR